jgi:hypothetical protein
MGELDFLKKLHDDLLEFSRKLTFDKSHPWHRNLVSLYGSLIELSGSFLILLNKRGLIGIPSIFRTFLETYVEFYNLLNDKKYGYHMEAQYNDQWVRLMKEAAKGTNPYLNSIHEDPDLHQKINTMGKKLKELKSKGYVPLKVRERFEKAGMLNEYYSMYNLLSTDTHGNIRALIKRHIEIKGADFDIVFYKDEPIEEFLTYIDATCGMLIQASIGIHELLGSKIHAEVKTLKEELEAWRRKNLLI